MGRDKPLLRLGGKTLVGRTIDVLSQAVDEVLVAADREGRFAELEHVRVVPDRFPGIGPLGGIHAGLRATDRDAGFVVACDMPLLDAGVMAGQIALWRTTDADACVPVVDGRPEPLHAVYAKRCLPAIEAQIGRGERRVRALFENIRVRFWEPSPAEARTFTNVNTPADWAELASSGDAEEC